MNLTVVRNFRSEEKDEIVAKKNIDSPCQVDRVENEISNYSQKMLQSSYKQRDKMRGVIQWPKYDVGELFLILTHFYNIYQ